MNWLLKKNKVSTVASLSFVSLWSNDFFQIFIFSYFSRLKVFQIFKNVFFFALYCVHFFILEHTTKIKERNFYVIFKYLCISVFVSNSCSLLFFFYSFGQKVFFCFLFYKLKYLLKYFFFHSQRGIWIMCVYVYKIEIVSSSSFWTGFFCFQGYSKPKRIPLF